MVINGHFMPHLPNEILKQINHRDWQSVKAFKKLDISDRQLILDVEFHRPGVVEALRQMSIDNLFGTTEENIFTSFGGQLFLAACKHNNLEVLNSIWEMLAHSEAGLTIREKLLTESRQIEPSWKSDVAKNRFEPSLSNPPLALRTAIDKLHMPVIEWLLQMTALEDMFGEGIITKEIESKGLTYLLSPKARISSTVDADFQKTFHLLAGNSGMSAGLSAQHRPHLLMEQHPFMDSLPPNTLQHLFHISFMRDAISNLDYTYDLIGGKTTDLATANQTRSDWINACIESLGTYIHLSENLSALDWLITKAAEIGMKQEVTTAVMETLVGMSTAPEIERTLPRQPSVSKKCETIFKEISGNWSNEELLRFLCGNSFQQLERSRLQAIVDSKKLDIIKYVINDRTIQDGLENLSPHDPAERSMISNLFNLFFVRNDAVLLEKLWGRLKLTHSSTQLSEMQQELLENSELLRIYIAFAKDFSALQWLLEKVGLAESEIKQKLTTTGLETLSEEAYDNKWFTDNICQKFENKVLAALRTVLDSGAMAKISGESLIGLLIEVLHHGSPGAVKCIIEGYVSEKRASLELTVMYFGLFLEGRLENPKHLYQIISSQTVENPNNIDLRTIVTTIIDYLATDDGEGLFENECLEKIKWLYERAEIHGGVDLQKKLLRMLLLDLNFYRADPSDIITKKMECYIVDWILRKANLILADPNTAEEGVTNDILPPHLARHVSSLSRDSDSAEDSDDDDDNIEVKLKSLRDLRDEFIQEFNQRVLPSLPNAICTQASKVPSQVVIFIGYQYRRNTTTADYRDFPPGSAQDRIIVEILSHMNETALKTIQTMKAELFNQLPDDFELRDELNAWLDTTNEEYHSNLVEYEFKLRGFISFASHFDGLAENCLQSLLQDNEVSDDIKAIVRKVAEDCGYDMPAPGHDMPETQQPDVLGINLTH